MTVPALRDGGIYRFGITMRTPFAGQRVVISGAAGGYDVRTLEEWATLAPARIRVDSLGRVLFHGRFTGYQVDMLLDTGATAE